MNLIILVLVLALLSLSQRLLPWALMSRFQGHKRLEQVFNLFAVSAFAALAVYNLNSVTLGAGISLALAVVIAFWKKNLGYAVLAAIAASVAFSFIL